MRRPPAPRLARAAAAMVVAGLVTACAAGVPAGAPGSPAPSSSSSGYSRGPGVGPVPSSTPRARPPSADFPEPHPEFARHFADPVYHDDSDELAPFGSDEGFDTLYGWAEHPQDLTACTTVASMLVGDDASPDPSPSFEPDEDGIVVGAGFTLLFFTGHIDPDGRRLVLASLRREAQDYDDESLRQFPVMLRDLESFEPTSCASATPTA